jgi:hypothetical protein
MRDLKFTRRWVSRLRFSGMWRRIVRTWVPTLRINLLSPSSGYYPITHQLILGLPANHSAAQAEELDARTAADIRTTVRTAYALQRSYCRGHSDYCQNSLHITTFQLHSNIYPWIATVKQADVAAFSICVISSHLYKCKAIKTSSNIMRFSPLIQLCNMQIYGKVAVAGPGRCNRQLWKTLLRIKNKKCYFNILRYFLCLSHILEI